jgi:hypothetical protein
MGISTFLLTPKGAKSIKSRTNTMRIIKLTTLLLALLSIAGCASSGWVHNVSPITAQKPFDLDLILVKTTSSLEGLKVEKQMLNDRIVSGLRETGLFKNVSANKDELGTGNGIIIIAEIKAIRKVSKDKRLWAGAMAGRARILVEVTVSDINTGSQIETFEAEGESSGGSALAGITDEAIERAGTVVAAEVVKINAQTAE